MMYFKILKQKESPAQKAMLALDKKMDECHEARKQILDEVGATQYVDARHAFATKFGGITAFIFDACPDNWKRKYGGQFKDTYYPKKTPENADLIARIQALPLISLDEFNAFINYEPFYGGPGPAGGRHYHGSYGWMAKEEAWLIEMHYNKAYTPLEGMEEITVTEYNSFKEKANDE